MDNKILIVTFPMTWTSSVTLDGVTGLNISVVELCNFLSKKKNASVNKDII
jgi:hypothetical protein